MLTMSRLTNSLSGLFNPATAISKQYTNGLVYDALGFDWMEDQTVLKSTPPAPSPPARFRALANPAPP
jgi:hypothetical protein